MRLIAPACGLVTYFLFLNTQIQDCVAPLPLALIGAKLIAKKVMVSGASKLAAKGLAKGALKNAARGGMKSLGKSMGKAGSKMKGRLSKGLGKGRRGASRLGGKSQAKSKSKLNDMYDKYDAGMSYLEQADQFAQSDQYAAADLDGDGYPDENTQSTSGYKRSFNVNANVGFGIGGGGGFQSHQNGAGFGAETFGSIEENAQYGALPQQGQINNFDSVYGGIVSQQNDLLNKLVAQANSGIGSGINQNSGFGDSAQGPSAFGDYGAFSDNVHSVSTSSFGESSFNFDNNFSQQQSQTENDSDEFNAYGNSAGGTTTQQISKDDARENNAASRYSKLKDKDAKELDESFKEEFTHQRRLPQNKHLTDAQLRSKITKHSYAEAENLIKEHGQQKILSSSSLDSLEPPGKLKRQNGMANLQQQRMDIKSGKHTKSHQSLSSSRRSRRRRGGSRKGTSRVQARQRAAELNHYSRLDRGRTGTTGRRGRRNAITSYHNQGSRKSKRNHGGVSSEYARRMKNKRAGYSSRDQLRDDGYGGRRKTMRERYDSADGSGYGDGMFYGQPTPITWPGADDGYESRMASGKGSIHAGELLGLMKAAEHSGDEVCAIVKGQNVCIGGGQGGNY